MEAKRPYKDTLFRHIFNDRNKVIPLYNAISGNNYPSDTSAEIVTLEDVIFSGFHNDLAFTVGDIVVVLVEHQSTLNPNMPLRMLIYYSKLLEKIIDKDTLCRSVKVPVPTPVFYVLYNGVDKCDKQSVMRLSDLYMSKRATYPLDLEVNFLDINAGVNEDMVRVCAELYGYADFVDIARRFEREGCTLTEAVTKAVNYCIEHNNPLKEYFMKNMSEVVNMFTTEWDWDKEKRMSREDGKVEGKAEGKAEGIQEGVKKGLLEKAVQTAKNLLSLGLDVEQITYATDLDRETVMELANAQ